MKLTGRDILAVVIDMGKQSGTKFLLLLIMGNLVSMSFYLGIFHQNVALYDREAQKVYVTDTPVRSLPLADQEALLDGVPLDSLQAAVSALEDFCS